MKRKPTAQIWTLETLAVGERAAFTHKIEERNISAFAQLSGDYSPLHMDAAYAATTPFARKVVHGMYLGALVSQLVGMHLPGRHSLLVKEVLAFKEPVHIGDIVTVRGEVVAKSMSTSVIELKIEIVCDSHLVASGSAYVRMLQ